MLHIRTLGASEITVAGTRVSAEQPMTFALLLLLAMSGHGGLSRRELAATLWPHAPDRHRNHRLRSLLHRVRRLGAPLARTGTSVVLETRAIDFREFIASPTSLDVVRARVDDIGAVLPGLSAASAALTDRLDDIRDLIVGTMTRWLNAGVALARAANDWPLVERLATAAEAVDPSDDHARLQRAEAACLTGDAERALAVLDELAARGATDEAILNAAAALRRRIAAVGVTANDTPLVGREEIVRRLWSAIGRAAAGRGGAILLWGPPGVGKTRLLRELEAVRLTGTARLVRLDARPLHALRPFAMILELAGTLLDEPGAAGCDPQAYALLARARNAALPNDHGAAIGTVGEETFCDAVGELLAAVTDESPTILAIDDAHAVDGAFWRALRGLLRWSGERRLLWVFAYRALHEAELASAPEATVVHRIRVRCLDATAAATLTRTIARSPSIDHEELFDITGGHPLLLQAVARTGGSVPSHLEWVVDDCIARLPSETLRALRLVAALGDVTPKALADLGIFTRAELAGALDELERAGMIREQQGVLRAHRVWAAAALAAITQGDRAALDIGVSRSPAMSER